MTGNYDCDSQFGCRSVPLEIAMKDLKFNKHCTCIFWSVEHVEDSNTRQEIHGS